MNADSNARGSERPNGRGLRVIGSFVFCVIVLIGVVPQAGAGGVEPTIGGWKGKTAQGMPIFFGVREGGVVTNVRLDYKDVVCGQTIIHKRNVSLKEDESGHFAGIVYPANGVVELEGTFTGPRRVRGRIVAGESSGLPGCRGGKIAFTAHPRPRSDARRGRGPHRRTHHDRTPDGDSHAQDLRLP